MWRTLANPGESSHRKDQTISLNCAEEPGGLIVTKEPNVRLADLFGLTGWSKGELARRVNRHAAAAGHQRLATDTSRVRRWMETGETPRDPVPEVLAALFTERLGRVVTIDDLGFGRHRRTRKTQATEGLPWPPERIAEVLTEFTGMDLMLNRRGLVGVGAALTAGSVLASAMHDWLTANPAGLADGPFIPSADILGSAEHASVNAREAGAVGAEEVAALEQSVEIFRAWDAQRGGGLQRKAVVGQLNEVGGMLTHRHPPQLQRRLWGVAADLAVLAGWMSHDVGLEPTAQKYFLIAAHAAREGGDRPRASEAISRVARQKVHLKQPDEALELMRLAQAGAGPDAQPRTRSMMYTIEAWAQAAMGQGQAVRRALGKAEDLFATDPPKESAPKWMQLFDEADLHGMEALAYRTLADYDPSVAGQSKYHGALALSLRTGKRHRSVIFDHIALASVCFISGDPDQAEEHARDALSCISDTSSHRTWDRLGEVCPLTDRYADYPKIHDLRTEISRAIEAATKANTV